MSQFNEWLGKNPEIFDKYKEMFNAKKVVPLYMSPLVSFLVIFIIKKEFSETMRSFKNGEPTLFCFRYNFGHLTFNFVNFESQSWCLFLRDVHVSLWSIFSEESEKQPSKSFKAQRENTAATFQDEKAFSDNAQNSVADLGREG